MMVIFIYPVQALLDEGTELGVLLIITELSPCVVEPLKCNQILAQHGDPFM
jgi:hypothetical protein